VSVRQPGFPTNSGQSLRERNPLSVMYFCYLPGEPSRPLERRVGLKRTQATPASPRLAIPRPRACDVLPPSPDEWKEHDWVQPVRRARRRTPPPIPNRRPSAKASANEAAVPTPVMPAGVQCHADGIRDDASNHRPAALSLDKCLAELEERSRRSRCRPRFAPLRSRPASLESQPSRLHLQARA